MKRKLFSLCNGVLVILFLLGTIKSYSQSTTFNYSASIQTWTVPSGVSTIGIDARGASGGSSSANAGGCGGRVRCVLAVTPGQVLNISVGSMGSAGTLVIVGSGGKTGPTTSGGQGGPFTGSGPTSGGGGGGASDIRVGGVALSNRVIVAGGGGGAGYYCGTGEAGGTGGGAGVAGGGFSCNALNLTTAGQGGSTTGGAAATLGGGPGVLLTGGPAGIPTYGSGGGGGGGYFGGGGAYAGGGGGGSSYTDPVLVSGAVHTAGGNCSSDGMVVITVCGAPPVVAAITGSPSICQDVTSTMNDATPGGEWSSSSPGFVSVDNSGNVTGHFPGTATISYSLDYGCGTVSATQPVTVTTSPSPVSITPSRSASVCIGGNATFTASSSLPSTLVYQDFNSGLTGATGGTWSIVNTGATSPYNWNIVPSNAYANVTAYTGLPLIGDGSSMAATNADLAGSSVTLNTYLISPSFSTVGYSGATVAFNYYCYSTLGSDINVDIDYSIDGGGSWPTLYSYTGTMTGVHSWQAGIPTQTITLPPAAVGQPNVMLRWHYLATYGYFWAVDNIIVSGLTGIPSTSYTWAGISGASGLSCSSCATTTISPPATGVNVYSVTATAAGCSRPAGVTVAVGLVGPPVAPITGTFNVCPAGDTTMLSSATSGGVWSSGNTSIATVGSTGIVSGISAGSVPVTYAVSNSCGTSTTSTWVTVGNPIITTIAGGGLSLGDNGPATTGLLSSPTCVFVDAAGNKLITEYSGHRVRKVSPLGIITTIAGTGTAGYGGDGLAATNAQLNSPAGVCEDLAGNIYIAEQVGNRIRKINTSGIITTICGNGTGTSSGDNSPATAVTIAGPTSVITDASGNIYFTEWSGGHVRKIDPAGMISTIAGGSFTLGDGGPATAAYLAGPYGISLDGQGRLFIADQSNMRIRQVDLSTGIITTVAGTGATGFGPDNGPATSSAIGQPAGVFADAYSIYISDGNQRVRRVNRNSGIITTIAGTGVASYFGDGVPASAAQLHTPSGLMLDNTGSIYFADFANARVRKVTMMPPTLAPITGSTGLCIGVPTTLADATGGGVWSSSNNAIATVGTSGIATGITSGTDTIRYTISAACGAYAASQAVTVGLPPVTPAPITGPTVVCTGTAISMNDVTPGGTWSSTQPLIATAGSTGIITGVSAGTAVISYTNTTACNSAAATVTVTVTSPTGSIAGPTSLCLGTTITLSGTPTGGTWSSSNTAAATIGTAGDITSLSVDTTTITYTYGGGCTATSIITVNPAPTSITGPGAVCAGTNTTYTASGTGIWSSGTTSVATIGSVSGTLSALTPGTTLVTFTLSGGCAASMPVTVNASPGTITPATPVAICVGATSILSEPPGGTWSSGATSVAIVNSLGFVTAMSAGTATISYTNASGCSAIKTITVNTTPLPLSPSSLAICMGMTGTLSESVGGGIWTSDAAGTASVSGGVVSGVSAGAANISYTIGSCLAIAPVTVNALPAAITPATPVAICAGANTALGNTTPGGTWSSDAPSIASVGTSGIVTALSSGTANISYTTISGCAAVKTITVNITPTALSPAGTTVCTGVTATLTDGVGGGIWTSGASGTASVSGGVVTGVSAGTATITYTIGSCFATADVTVNLSPNAGTITGSASLCSGSPVTFTDIAAGGVWSSSNGAIATVSASGVVTGTGAGTAVISYSVTNGCGTANAIFPVAVTTTAAAGTITGLSVLCAGTYTALIDTTTGGVWSSSNSNASITATGILTGITPGTDTIYYTVVNSCGTASISHVVTIGPYLTAGAVSGPGTVCAGSSITLSDPAPGGVWSSSNAHGSVSGGIVTGVSGGRDTIAYTVSSGCGSVSATYPVDIIPIPVVGAISGPSALCAGSSATYSNSASGGVWSVSNTAATISGTGIVTATTPGADTITYTLSNVCGTAQVSRTLVIGPALSAGSISGSNTVCQGATITLTDGVPGGVWTVSNTNAVVSGGAVRGVAAGTVTVSYTVSSSCGSVSATYLVTVNPLPVAGTISGASGVCLGSTITLTDPVPGGAWSASNANAAVSGGVVTGMAAGADIISYTVTNSCGSVSATKPVTVSTSATAGTITGPGNVCAGAMILLTSSSPGGTWGSSNTAASVSGGAVTGVAAGVDTISYTVTTACGTAVTTALVTVNPLPVVSSISGPITVCIGAGITLTDATAGGFWSTGNTNATVSGGLVTGIAAGTDVISYTVFNACGATSATSLISIDAVPFAGAITGAGTVCTGGTISLTDPITGGIWSATNAAATVSAGTVTGVSAGTDTILYTVANSCGSAFASAVVRINSTPTAGTIIGPSNICIGASATLTNTISGGNWSASNGLATVSGTGLVTAVAAGVDTIGYTVTTGCGSASATKVITITQPPVVSGIDGPATVCVGSAITLTDATAGGIWSSSNAFVAPVSTTGLVSGVSVGSAIIAYTASNTCGNRSTIHTVTVLSHDLCTSAANGVARADDELTVFPNPNQGTFSINLVTGNDERVNVIITDIAGRQIQEFTTTTNKLTEVQLSVAPGIYLLKANTASRGYVAKLTIN